MEVGVETGPGHLVPEFKHIWNGGCNTAPITKEELVTYLTENGWPSDEEVAHGMCAVQPGLSLDLVFLRVGPAERGVDPIRPQGESTAQAQQPFCTISEHRYCVTTAQFPQGMGTL